VQLYRDERRDPMRQLPRHADVFQAAKIRIPNPEHPPLPSFRPVHRREFQFARILGQESCGGEKQVVSWDQLEHDEPELGFEEQFGGIGEDYVELEESHGRRLLANRK